MQLEFTVSTLTREQLKKDEYERANNLDRTLNVKCNQLSPQGHSETNSCNPPYTELKICEEWRKHVKMCGGTVRDEQRVY